jgi:hypothetical protein
MADRVIRPDAGNDVVIEDAGSTDRLRITDGGSTVIYEDGGAASLTIDTDGNINLTQDIYLAAGKGIYFDGGTTSANYLGGSDAYEEGTFDINQGGVGTPTARYGKYIKIGNICHIFGYVVPSSTSTNFQSLPFTSANVTFAGGGSTQSQDNDGSVDQLGMFVSANSTTVIPYHASTNESVTSGSSLYFTLTYQTA